MNAEDLLREARREATNDRGTNLALMSIARSLIDLNEGLTKLNTELEQAIKEAKHELSPQT